MKIKADITGIEYEALFTNKLKIFGLKDFDINQLPSTCLIQENRYSFALSKWVSPKRTRSYPYQRVYDTLAHTKKITVIPVIKDEGKRGDRDFIQWDTVSLMSLLDVFVIFAYYVDAEPHQTLKGKVTNQQFDNEWVKQKVIEITHYHSSALHWNLKEVEQSLPILIQKTKSTCQRLRSQLGIEFHAESGIDRFAKQFSKDVSNFMKTSRQKAKQAQYREKQTVQPKEALSTATKATITIKNYLGGEYYFTTDETILKEETLFLIEGKHSIRNPLPALSDIKDSLLKMVLYTNLKQVMVNGYCFFPVPVVKLTSTQIVGRYASDDHSVSLESFVVNNRFSLRQQEIIDNLLAEAKQNGFAVYIENSK